jgi:endonuclease G
MRHGLPSADNILRVYNNFVVSVDLRHRNPKWVVEHLTKENNNDNDTNGNRQYSQFKEDSHIPPRFRAKLTDYKYSGYDRGHMAPAANHKSSQQAMDDTFTLTNTCPQNHEVNANYWARFEKYVQSLTKTCDDVWIVTGPLYLPRSTGSDNNNSSSSSSNSNIAKRQQEALEKFPKRLQPTYNWEMAHPMLGTPPQLVAVPTHFYKVVLAEQKRSTDNGSNINPAVVGAFVVPNKVVNKEAPLSSFAVPLSALEEVAGCEFFPEFLTAEKRRAIDEAALGWQQYGRSRLILELEEEKQGSSSPSLLLEGGGNSSSDDHHMLLLPPIPSASISSSGSDSSKKKEKRVVVMPPRTREVTAEKWGIVHICEHGEGCKLPAERWWESNKGKVSDSEKGKLKRSASSPGL